MSELAIEARPEVVKTPRPVVSEFIDRVGNHEVKLLTAAMVLLDPDKLHSSGEIRSQLIQHQGDTPAWHLNHSTPTQFFKLGLEPSGTVVKGNKVGIRGKTVDAWQAVPEHLDRRLALTGFLLDWSLRYPDLSLQHVYGSTTSRGAVRSPYVRHGIYLGLLTGDENGSLIHLYESLKGSGYANKTGLHQQIYNLDTLGIVQLASRKYNFNPSLRIIDPEFKHLTLALEETLPETQALYTAMGRLGESKTTLYELVNLAHEINPDVDPVRLRQLVMKGLVRGVSLPGLVIEEGLTVIDEQSSVQINSEAKEAIADLCEGVEAVQEGFRIEQYISMAKDIVHDPEKFIKLVSKAKQSSSNFASSGNIAGTESQLSAIISSLGSVTVLTARAELEKRFGRKMSKSTVNRILNGMHEKGLLEVGESNKDPLANLMLKDYGKKA